MPEDVQNHKYDLQIRFGQFKDQKNRSTGMLELSYA